MKTCFILFFLSFSGFSSSGGHSPGLKVGDRVSNFSVKTSTGKDFTLNDIDSKTVIVFYRGSWCPYCVKQLKDLESKLLPKLEDVKLIGVSVDRLAVAQKMKSKLKLNFTVLSDPKAATLKSFKIVNKLDDELVEKYKNSYKIDVEGDSGETHHLVAHPAVFIVSKDKKVLFSDVHVNYKQRTSIDKILSFFK